MLRMIMAGFVLAWAGVLGGGTAFAGERTEVPAFIAMFGEWESRGVRAEPPQVFEAMPHLAALHAISGEPTRIQPGIRFLVRQDIGGKVQTTELTYVHDAAAGKSFGVILGSDGSTLRGVIEHGSEADMLTLYDAAGDVVWAERKVWVSQDMFESEGVFTFNGAPAKVWFKTWRKGTLSGN